MLTGFTDWPEELVRMYQQQGYWRGQTLGDALRERARAAPHELAVVDGDVRLSYAELDMRADRLAAGLFQRGIEAQQRVLVHLPNSAEFLVLCFALFRLGAIPVLALPGHREQEIVQLAQLSEAVAYVIADTHGGFDYRILARTVCRQAPSIRHVWVAGDGQEFVALSSIEREPRALVQPSSRDVALLLLSGGTTGTPKLIPRTHDDYLCNAERSAAVAGVTARTRYLVALPIAHNFALGCPGALGTLFAGGTVVLCRDPSPDVAFPIIARERVTMTSLVPPLVLVWLEAAEERTFELDSLSLVQVGGARLKPTLAARIEPTLGCKLQQVYGMAEGLLNFTRLDDSPELVLHTQGVAMTEHDELRIVDEAGKDVPSGALGELWVRGPYTIRGYYCAKEHNRSAFSSDGFYRSGDLVRRLPSGHLSVEGRSKDVVNRGGDKVPVEEIESYLAGHPKIRDVAIVGVADDVLGERSCACIIARGTPPNLSELNAVLRGRGIASFKLIDRVVVMESFPQTTVGKVNRRALASLVETDTHAGSRTLERTS